MSHIFEDLPANVNIGEPAGAWGLRVFPLFPTGPTRLTVLPLAGALSQGLAEISELGPDQAPEGEAWFRGLWVKNLGTAPILLRDGDVLLGGKQDRIVDHPMLVDAQAGAPIPVSCVEQSRSHYAGQRGMRLARMGGDPELRRTRLESRHNGRPDQSRTWARVAERRHRAGLGHAGGSLREVQARTHATAERLLAAFPAPYGATGLAVARDTPRGPRVILVEWFCDPEALRLSWERIIGALVSVSSEEEHKHPRISRTEVRRVLEHLAQTQQAPGPDQTVVLSGGWLSGAGLEREGEPVYLGAVA